MKYKKVEKRRAEKKEEQISKKVKNTVTANDVMF